MKKIAIVLAGICLMFNVSLVFADMGDAFATAPNSSGAAQFRVTSTGGVVNSGANTISGTTSVTGQMTFSVAPIIPIVDVAVTSPTAAGQIVRTSANVVYVSSAAVAVSNWLKVGAQ